MDVHRLRRPDWLTGIAGVALLLLLWTPWYTVSDGTLNGWQAFGVMDFWLLLTAALAIALAVVTATKDSPAMPVFMDVVCAAVATISLLLMIFRLLNVPQDDIVTGREWGLYAAAGAVAATCLGAWWAQRDESSPGVRRPEIQALAAPPANAGPERTTAET